MFMETKNEITDKRKIKNAVCEVEIIYKRPIIAEPQKILSSSDAEKILRLVYDANRIDLKEFFFVVLLARNNTVLGVAQISMGSTTGTIVSPKEIFQLAIKANACSILISHNHPSGNLKPSKEDIEITTRIKDGTKLLDFVLIDHLILTSEGYYSFADAGFI